jgi:hypothetical protein
MIKPLPLILALSMLSSTSSHALNNGTVTVASVMDIAHVGSPSSTGYMHAKITGASLGSSHTNNKGTKTADISANHPADMRPTQAAGSLNHTHHIDAGPQARR